MSVSSDFATILRVYVGSDTDDESDSDESDVEDTHAHAQRIDKGKGCAFEPGPASGWEANVEAGDFLDDSQYLCVDPRDPEVFGVEGGVYADAGGWPYVDNEQDDCMENDDAEVSPTAGPSTGAAYNYGAGPIASAPVAWGTLQQLNTQYNMNEGSSALGTEQPNRLPSSNIGAKRKRAANNDDAGSDERTTEVPVVPGMPLHTRMSDAAIQRHTLGQRSTHTRRRRWRTSGAVSSQGSRSLSDGAATSVPTP
ncbi:hypothetical protein NLJ89_g10556 [Agrocybe chaxingu]|uniref:Uncharacterized protein n=1 Tax=Agrocybe chaxingu TaxID=84603 RepID=A0A9W8MS09_9AGAR|nr:hypothetical protein NLJ89_g10556 [Agrocybe chaxingu]